MPSQNEPFHKKLMLNKIILALFASFTLTAHAASSARASSETCDLDYQIEAKWDDTPRRFDVTLSFDADAKGRAALTGPKSWGGVDDFDNAIRDVRVVGDGATLKSVASNGW